MKAFPTEHPIAGTMNLKADGMDLRDYFAAKAMQADISTYTTEREFDVEHWEVNAIAQRSYRMADAMMKAREE